MPHIIVSHSDQHSLDMKVLLRDLHDDLAAHESVDPTQIKTYAYPIKDWITGRGDQYKMIHVEIKMKPGRSEQTRKQMAAQMHDILRRHTAEAGIPFAVSVEVHELHEPTYHSSYLEG